MEWDPEFDVDETLARQLIGGQFPHLDGAPIARFGASMDNVAYLVAERYVFRFPRRAIVAPLLEREERILPLIAQQVPLPVPFPQFIGKPDLRYPWTFAGYERLRGTNACSVDLSSASRLPRRPFRHAHQRCSPARRRSRGAAFDRPDALALEMARGNDLLRVERPFDVAVERKQMRLTD